jgi:hypothetical protein
MAAFDISQNNNPRAVESWLSNVTGKGKITIAPLEWLPLEFVCFNMRDIDRHEIYSNLPTTNPLEWAAGVFAAVGRKGCGWHAAFNGRPAAVMGVFENFPGNWQIFSFGTDDYIRVLVAFKPKWYLMLDYLKEHGGHRLECKSLITHKEAHGFLRMMGFKAECVLDNYGRHREDYILFKQVFDVPVGLVTGPACRNRRWTCRPDAPEPDRAADTSSHPAPASPSAPR